MPFTDAEKHILAVTGKGRYADAEILISEYEEAGGPPAMILLLRANIRALVDSENYPEAIRMLERAVHSRGANPAAQAAILVELTRLAFRLNHRQTMRRARMRLDQLWLEHKSDQDVAYWRGPSLLNLANHAIRNGENSAALTFLNEAMLLLSMYQEHWCRLFRSLMQRSWCNCLLGNVVGAEEDYAAALRLDVSGRYQADALLARSRVALARGNFEEATETAQAAVEAAKRESDWQIVTEAKYQQLLLACRENQPERWLIAEEVRGLACRHNLAYMARYVKQALYSVCGKEVSESWNAASN